MVMQTDVKMTHLNASGTVFAGRCRIKGFVVCPTAGSAGTVVIKDGGSSGTAVIEFDITSNTNPNTFTFDVPGEGVLCSTSAYATITTVNSVTVFYG
jgi:hypothetical protein